MEALAKAFLEWHGVWSLVLWGFPPLVAWGMFRSAIRANPVELFEGRFEMRGNRKVKAGWGDRKEQ